MPRVLCDLKTHISRAQVLARGGLRGITKAKSGDGAILSFYSTVFSEIDLRSFSNIWFWIALAVLWSNVTHYVLGVPYDMVLRARRLGAWAMADLEAMTNAQARRRVLFLRGSGVWIVGFWAAMISALLVLAISFQFELAQALSLLFVPLTLVGFLGIRFALRQDAAPLTGEALVTALIHHRFAVQALGLLAVFLTTMWGMWYNLALRPFGG